MLSGTLHNYNLQQFYSVSDVISKYSTNLNVLILFEVLIDKFLSFIYFSNNNIIAFSQSVYSQSIKLFVIIIGLENYYVIIFYDYKQLFNLTPISNELKLINIIINKYYQYNLYSTQKKITQKTSNAEAQSENEKKILKQVRKLILRRILKNNCLIKRSLRTLKSRKRKSSQSQDQKTTQKLQSSTISLPSQAQLVAQSFLKRKLRKSTYQYAGKQLVLEKPVKPQPNDGQNELKRQLTQNRKPSQSQRKPRRINCKLNIRNSVSNNRELNKIPTRLNPRKQLIHHRQYTPKLGICKNDQINTEPRNLIKLMKRCIKYNKSFSRASRRKQ
ncbi:Hypothetical_protein [Hexamita inflata]|uniref:Hypothetical_protein n=1 Tax=Hexamita inflata TaxID=28002 RepID=A0AA86UKN2_9EUKA|nr:Hypothetical protein HINF_LOCUS42871 [Hexamita inflata]